MSTMLAPPADVRDATRELGAWVAGLRWSAVPADVRTRAGLVLADTLGVTLAGMRTSEMKALVEATSLPRGTASLIDAGRGTNVDQAAYLHAVAGCSLELDEGNKHARGHPAIHAFPAAVAVAEELDADGERLGAALVAGHEVASRFGRATVLRPGVHPHGPWGAPGAAAAAAVLLDLDAGATAGALDAATGLGVAGPFESALRGTFVRNSWAGLANTGGLAAARLARAGLAPVDGTAEASLGQLLGTFDPGALGVELGVRYDLPLGYLKRHSSCSYTHAAADAALALRERCAIDEIEAVEVETHRYAAALDRKRPASRLAAMFSIPHVIAVALRHGEVQPRHFDDEHRADAELRRLSERVSVRHSEALDPRLPAERVARVGVRLTGGRSDLEEASNPIGDADRQPLGEKAVAAKLAALVGPAAAASIRSSARVLLSPGSVRARAVALRDP